MKKKNFFMHIISFVMVLCICITSVASSYPEGDATENMIAKEYASESGLDISTLTVDNLPEFISKSHERELKAVETIDSADAETLNTLTLVNADGSKTAIIYDRPIKYVDKEEKAIKFIDNSLVKSKDRQFAYTNAANVFDFSMSKKASDGIVLEDLDGNTLSVTPVIKTDATAAYNNNYEFNGMSYKVVEYKDVFGDGTRLQYAASDTGFKENIILDTYNADFNRFQFVVKVPGFVPESTKGQSIKFVSTAKKDSEEETAYYIQPLYDVIQQQ